MLFSAANWWCCRTTENLFLFPYKQRQADVTVQRSEVPTSAMRMLRWQYRLSCTPVTYDHHLLVTYDHQLLLSRSFYRDPKLVAAGPMMEHRAVPDVAKQCTDMS